MFSFFFTYLNQRVSFKLIRASLAIIYRLTNIVLPLHFLYSSQDPIALLQIQSVALSQILGLSLTRLFSYETEHCKKMFITLNIDNNSSLYINSNHNYLHDMINIYIYIYIIIYNKEFCTDFNF